jgi:hypothetical protein
MRKEMTSLVNIYIYFFVIYSHLFSLCIDVFDDAVQNKLLLSSMEDLITILLAKCDYERRQIDWSDRK